MQRTRMGRGPEMKKTANEYVTIYQKALVGGEMQIAYEYLVKYVMALKAQFEKELSVEFKTGNVSPGYMDYTYFPFFNDFLRVRKLRFGIVLNHQKMCFELWLMGQNAQVQRTYWEILKTKKWNIEQTEMPKYSVLETVLVECLDFDDPMALSAKTIALAKQAVIEIMAHIESN